MQATHGGQLCQLTVRVFGAATEQEAVQFFTSLVKKYAKGELAKPEMEAAKAKWIRKHEKTDGPNVKKRPAAAAPKTAQKMRRGKIAKADAAKENAEEPEGPVEPEEEKQEEEACEDE
eukprot:9490706-Pyramimonas_sp.AAC.1